MYVLLGVLCLLGFWAGLAIYSAEPAARGQ